MSTQILLYCEVNLMCIAILISIYVRDLQQRNNDTQHMLFSRVLVTCIIFFACDIFWGVMELSAHPHITVNWIVNILYFSISGVVAYFWLDFVERMINPAVRFNIIQKIIRMLPMIMLILLSFISIKNHWLFYIDDKGDYQRGSLYLLQIILAYIMPIYATFKAIVATVKTDSVVKKHQYRSLAMFYVLPAIGGVAQVFLDGTPMLSIGIAISGLWVYFTFQDNEIMLDPLTSLNNRRYFDKQTENMIHGYNSGQDSHLWLIIMDVDYFKSINDGFGHAEGDKALITVANAISKVCESYNCVTARIGGDEFAVCIESKNNAMSDIICDLIGKELIKISEGFPYKLKLSMGCAEYNTDMTAIQLFINADKKLYDVKKAR